MGVAGLLNANIAGAGVDVHLCTAAANLARHVVFSQRSLGRDIAVAVNAAGAGIGVQRQPWRCRSKAQRCLIPYAAARCLSACRLP